MPWIQDEGLAGRAVGAMIRRSVQKQFKAVYWEPVEAPPAPCIFVANHHGWYDGYLMYHLVTRLGRRSVDWIQEFDAFPLFAKVGGMPFRLNDPTGRAETVRRTVRLMKNEGRSLILFAEGVLHYPPEILPFGKNLATVERLVPNATIVPVAISYEFAMHERAEAFIRVGSPVSADGAREAMQTLLTENQRLIRAESRPFEVLVKGTDSVNERLDMRRFRR